MYKVFFNDRNVFLTDDFTKYFEVKYGLFYKFRNITELKDLLNLFGTLKSIRTVYIFHFDILKLQEAFRSCFTYIEAAGGLVTNNQNEVLLIHRKGKYDLPKGKLDADETYQQAAIREVKEECGIDNLAIIKPLISTYHIYQGEEGLVLKKTYWFDMFHKGNEKPVPQTEEEIDQAFWSAPEKIVDTIAGNTYGSILDVLRYRKLVPLNIPS